MFKYLCSSCVIYAIRSERASPNGLHKWRTINMPFLIYVTTFNIRIRSIIAHPLLFPLSGSSLYIRYEETEPLFFLREIPGRANELSNPIDSGIERGVTFTFFARTYFVHDLLKEPARNRFSCFLAWQPSLSSLNKTLALTTIRKTTRASWNMIVLNIYQHISFRRNIKLEMNIYFLGEILIIRWKIYCD